MLKNHGISLVALKTYCVTRTGLRLRVFLHHSPSRNEECCLPVCTHFGQGPTVTIFRSSGTVQGSTVSRYLSSSLPFCVRFNVAVTRHAATLDTKPLAKSYSGGIRTHLFSNHFQYARATHCSPQVNHLYPRDVIPFRPTSIKLLTRISVSI
jgi:hypothetical protein